MGSGDGDGGDGGGFGAEDAGAEGNWCPVVLGEEGHLFGGPAALGADGEGVGGSGSTLRSFERARFKAAGRRRG